jgi:hypothetical protein
MSAVGVRLGVGTRLRYDGETVEVVEVTAAASGMEVVLADGQHRLLRLSVRELLLSDRAQVIADGPGPQATDNELAAAVLLGQMTEPQRKQLRVRAEHVREVLTGYRAGSAELGRPGEPRDEFDPGRPLEVRYAAKATELGVGVRTLKRWGSAIPAAR